MSRRASCGWRKGAAWSLAVLVITFLPVRAGRGADPGQGGAPVPPGPPSIRASAAILVDIATGTILFQRNAHQRRPNASTTKILTAIVILESGRLQEQVVFSKNAVSTDYANLNARAGERIALSELLYPIMMRSSNDGCVAAGEHLFGSAWGMAQAMNRKAGELGLRNTHFVTTNGLYHPQHYSSAADLAQMTRYAVQLPDFNQIVACRKCVIRRSMNKSDTVITNRNKFLGAYAGADGIKTGYVRQSGRCLVASATRMEREYPWRMVAVVLNSPDTNGECGALLNYGFRSFEPVFLARQGETLGKAKVSGGVASSVSLVASRDVIAIVARGSARPALSVVADPKLAAPLAKGQTAGNIYGTLDGRVVCEVEARAGAAVSSAGLPLWSWTLVLVGAWLGPRYARALAKGTRRRRRRLPATGRRADRAGAGDRERPARPRAGHAGRRGNGDDLCGWPSRSHPRSAPLPDPE